MTNEEAKMFLDNLKVCIDEHPVVADWLVEIADCKTESNSEKPNNCDTCKWGEWYRKGYDITMMDDECGGCCSWRSKWIPKTEPQYDFGEYADRLWKIAYERGKREALEQTEPTISKMEQVDKDKPRAEGVWNAGYKTGYDKGYKDAQKVKDSQDLVKNLVKAFCEDGTWLERQGVYTLTLAEAKQRAVDIIESVLAKDEPTTQTETQNSNLTFEKVMEEIQTQVIEFPDTHQKFTFARKIEMDGDSIKICGWEYKGVKDGEREGE